MSVNTEIIIAITLVMRDASIPRNLKKPPEPTKSYRKFKKRRVERMAKDHTVLETELTKAYPGYKFLDAEVRYNGINAAFYIYARMVRN